MVSVSLIMSSSSVVVDDSFLLVPQDEQHTVVVDDDGFEQDQFMLPIDCLIHIFEYCTAQVLSFTVPRVCRTWRHVLLPGSMTHELLWRQLCFGEWPILSMVTRCFVDSSQQEVQEKQREKGIEPNEFLVNCGIVDRNWERFFSRFAPLFVSLWPTELSDHCGTVQSILQNVAFHVDDDCNDYTNEKKKESEQKKQENWTVKQLRNRILKAKNSLNSLSLFAQSTVKQLERLEEYGQRRLRCMNQFSSLKQRLRHCTTNGNEKNTDSTDVDNNGTTLSRKIQQQQQEEANTEEELELLFLDWFQTKQLVREHQEIHNYIKTDIWQQFGLLGPVGRSVLVHFSYYACGSKFDPRFVGSFRVRPLLSGPDLNVGMNLNQKNEKSERNEEKNEEPNDVHAKKLPYDLSDLTDPNDPVVREERRRVAKEWILLYDFGNEELSKEFLSQMDKIRCHLGLRALSLGQLWTVLLRLIVQEDRSEIVHELNSELVKWMDHKARSVLLFA